MSNEPTPIAPPTSEQLDTWYSRIESLARFARAHSIHHDLRAVLSRIEREEERGGTLEGGCASRLVQLRARLTEAGLTNEAQEAYTLARQIIQHENLPSPGWNTLVLEAGLPADPTGTAND